MKMANRFPGRTMSGFPGRLVSYTRKDLIPARRSAFLNTSSGSVFLLLMRPITSETWAAVLVERAGVAIDARRLKLFTYTRVSRVPGQGQSSPGTGEKSSSEATGAVGKSFRLKHTNIGLALEWVVDQHLDRRAQRHHQRSQPRGRWRPNLRSG